MVAAVQCDSSPSRAWLRPAVSRAAISGSRGAMLRFRRPVVPGDRLELHVEKVQSRANVWKFSGKALVEGKVAAEATFAAMIRDRQ